MDPTDFAVISGSVLLFGLLSKRIEGTALTPPMVFVALGLLIGPAALDVLHLDLSKGALHVLAELTLVFVLFGDATRIDLSALRREVGLPVRLLGVGLPLSMTLGAVLGKLLLPQLGWWEAATLGAILAPTDAALGQAVVSSPAVPQRIRQALNVESGLNDGIALPFVLVFASLASIGHGEARTAWEWAGFAALQVTLGPLVGWACAWLGGKLMHRAIEAGYVAESFERIGGLGLALICFSGAELVGGNGFIAAFVGGATLGHTQKGRCRWMLEFLEADGQLLMLLVFLGLGASLAPTALSNATWPLLVYALLSLTAVRMLPVSVSLLSSGLRAPTHLFLGWFGPRGLASILYGILVLADASLPHQDDVFGAIVLTVLASVVAHGVTAAAGATLYGKAASDATSCPAEHTRATTHPLRRASESS